MTSELELRDYLAILHARRWTVILLTSVVLGVALTVSVAQTPMYRSSARVLVKPIPAGASVAYSVFPNLKTESELISSEPIASRVQRELGEQMSLRELVAGLEVRPLLDTEVIIVEYTSPDPEFARSAADTFASQYIAVRQEEALDAVASTEQSLRQRLEAISSGIAVAAEEAEQARQVRDVAVAAQAEAERSILTARLGVLEQRLDEIRPDLVSLAGGEIIQPADAASVPFAPNHARNGALGLVLGLMVGLGVAFLREYLSDRLRGGHEIEQIVGVPVLGTIPRFAGDGTDAILLADPESAASEAYRSLRTRIGYLLEGAQGSGVLVSSPAEGEGKTTTTANLGISFARVGRRVCLVSADLRRPKIESYFDLHSRWGLSSWLQDPYEGGWPNPLATAVPDLDVLPCGPCPDEPAELLSSPRFPALLTELGRRYDLVLVDSPPGLLFADAASLARHLEATILVLDATGTPTSAAIEAKLKLERSGASIMGCVLNGFDPSSGAYGYGYGRYGSYRRPADRSSGSTTNGSRVEPGGPPPAGAPVVRPPRQEEEPARGYALRRVLARLIEPTDR